MKFLSGRCYVLNGGADFYATDIEALCEEGKTSLKVFFDLCKEEGLNPTCKYFENSI